MNVPFSGMGQSCDIAVAAEEGGSGAGDAVKDG